MNKMMMIALCVGAAACGKGSGSTAGGAAALDDRAMMNLQKQVMGAKFEDAVKATEAVLGPARAKDETDWQYAVVQGDTCFQFGLMKDATGKTVDGVQNGSFKKSETMYADCEKMAKLPAAK
jgi:hypothetical protein